jgi:hypothetical protein
MSAYRWKTQVRFGAAPVAPGRPTGPHSFAVVSGPLPRPVSGRPGRTGAAGLQVRPVAAARARRRRAGAVCEMWPVAAAYGDGTRWRVRLDPPQRGVTG